MENLSCALRHQKLAHHFQFFSVQTVIWNSSSFSAYHCKCVDPWLTLTKKTCPVCKQRVTQNNAEHSESESEEEAGGRGEEEGAEGEADSERTPLLRPFNPGSPSGSLGAYSATTTTVTTAQCLASPARCDSPILGYEGYYSPQEDTDSESDDTEEDRLQTDDDTTKLIGGDSVQVWWSELSCSGITLFLQQKSLCVFSFVVITLLQNTLWLLDTFVDRIRTF